MGRMSRCAFAWAAVAVACAPLEEIAIDGQCGNLIVEPEANEDCDGTVQGSLRCGDPDEAGACRFVCPSAEAGCPAGWFCGADRICRAPSGRFGAPIELPFPAPLLEVEVANVDGDRFDDLVQLGFLELRVLFGGLEGSFDERLSFNIDVFVGELEPGDLDGDQRTDLVLGQARGPLFLRGTPRRTLEPIPRAALPLSSGDAPARLLPVRIEDVAGMFDVLAGRDGLLLVRGPDGFRAELPFHFVAEVSGAVDVGVGELPPSIAVADVDRFPSALGLDEIALGVEGGRSVAVFGVACDLTVESCRLEPRSRVDVLSPIVSGTYFADVDGDGAQDLLVHTEEGLQVAFGDGMGGFCAAPPSRCSALLLDKAAPLVVETSDAKILQAPLFVGELGHSPAADFIFATGVEVTPTLLVFGDGMLGPELTLGGLHVPLPTLGSDYAQMIGGDFNRDGITDVAALRVDRQTIDVLIGTGTLLFNPVTFRSEGAIDRMTGGDFDGDFHEDLAIHERNGEISVLFGSSRGLTEPVLMSRSDGVVDMVAIDVRSELGADLIGDLALTIGTPSQAGSGQRVLTVLHGSARRRMLAPLYFFEGEERLRDIFVGGRIGSLDDDDYADMLVLSRSADGEHRLWLLAGDPNAAGLPIPVQIGAGCPISVQCLGERTIFAELDGDPQDELLAASQCEGDDAIWFIDFSSLGFRCERVPELELAAGPDGFLAPIDSDLDGTFEIGIHRGDALSLARRDASGSWSIEPVTFSGGTPRQLRPLGTGVAGSRFAFLAGGLLYVGDIGDGQLVGRPIAAQPIDRRAGGRDFDEDGEEGQGASGDEIQLIDVAADGLMDLLLFGTTVFRQLECSAQDAWRGACTRQEPR